MARGPGERLKELEDGPPRRNSPKGGGKKRMQRRCGTKKVGIGSESRKGKGKDVPGLNKRTFLMNKREVTVGGGNPSWAIEGWEGVQRRERSLTMTLLGRSGYMGKGDDNVSKENAQT